MIFPDRAEPTKIKASKEIEFSRSRGWAPPRKRPIETETSRSQESLDIETRSARAHEVIPCATSLRSSTEILLQNALIRSSR
jgi:hypothetical protein